MSLLDALRISPDLLLFSCTMLGLVVGSFLNVVILRLPRMIDQGDRMASREVLGQGGGDYEPRITLMSPPSRCPTCHAGIAPWHNIPVLGWLLLRGRCASCSTKISPQYPLVEAVGGALAAACAWRFGFSLQLAGALVLVWALLALTVIDLREQILPDDITLPLLWLGLLLNVGGAFAPLADAVAGAAAGYLVLWLVYHGYRLLMRAEGMGFGDFKLLAVVGAWFGWQALPAAVLISSLAGSAVGLSLMALRNHGLKTKVPFGPFIALAALVLLLARDLLPPLLQPL